jgi:hypothetical protein
MRKIPCGPGKQFTLIFLHLPILISMSGITFQPSFHELQAMEATEPYIMCLEIQPWTQGFLYSPGQSLKEWQKSPRFNPEIASEGLEHPPLNASHMFKGHKLCEDKKVYNE